MVHAGIPPNSLAGAMMSSLNLGGTLLVTDADTEFERECREAVGVEQLPCFRPPGTRALAAALLHHPKPRRRGGRGRAARA